jgi:hypothetical protein
MRSDNHINVGRMTDFSFVTWACKYALVGTELWVTCVRVIYHAQSGLFTATVRRPHVLP